MAQDQNTQGFVGSPTRHSGPTTRGKRKLFRQIEVEPSINFRRIGEQLKENPKSRTKQLIDRIDKGDLTWSDIAASRGGVRKMYHGLADVSVPYVFNDAGRQRAVSTSAFPLLAGALTIAGVNEAYEMYPSIGQMLVEDMDDNKKWTHIAGILTEDTDISRVRENEDFPEIGAGEEKYSIPHRRNGRRLSITKEMIEENDVAGIQSRINALGDIAAETIEELTLERVTDDAGSAATPAEPYALHLNGSGTQLYNATANNPSTRAPSGTRVTNNALVDTTDLENVRDVLADMRNSRGKRIAIPINRTTLLVPDALVGTALKLLNSELEPGVRNEVNNWGPRGRYRPRLLSSPKLDDLSTSAWYLGWFEKQFVRKWKLRFEMVTLGEDTQMFLNRRIAFQARLAWDCEVGARNHVYCVQSLAGTTAPADE